MVQRFFANLKHIFTLYVLRGQDSRWLYRLATHMWNMKRGLPWLWSWLRTWSDVVFSPCNVIIEYKTVIDRLIADSAPVLTIYCVLPQVLGQPAVLARTRARQVESSPLAHWGSVMKTHILPLSAHVSGLFRTLLWMQKKDIGCVGLLAQGLRHADAICSRLQTSEQIPPSFICLPPCHSISYPVVCSQNCRNSRVEWACSSYYFLLAVVIFWNATFSVMSYWALSCWVINLTLSAPNITPEESHGSFPFFTFDFEIHAEEILKVSSLIMIRNSVISAVSVKSLMLLTVSCFLTYY